MKVYILQDSWTGEVLSVHARRQGADEATAQTAGPTFIIDCEVEDE